MSDHNNSNDLNQPNQQQDPDQQQSKGRRPDHIAYNVKETRNGPSLTASAQAGSIKTGKGSIFS